MRSALVVGSNGQDGSFLCRRLLARGYAVLGVGKQSTPVATFDAGRFRYVAVDLARGSAELGALLGRERPDLVFHVAAVHASSGLAQYEAVFERMLSVNVASMHCVLEYLRTQNPDARALYASSGKVFGAPLPENIDERTPRTSPCLYAVTKNATSDTIDHYRRTHGCHASQLYLFNHESELRPASFFIPKLARVLAAALQSKPCDERFSSLDFHCDWGSAEEYMDIAVDCVERAPGQDFVLASGRCLYARELVLHMAQKLGAQLSERQTAVSSSANAGQPAYHVDTAKLRAALGRVPEVGIETVIARLVERLIAGA